MEKSRALAALVALTVVTCAFSFARMSAGDEAGPEGITRPGGHDMNAAETLPVQPSADISFSEYQLVPFVAEALLPDTAVGHGWYPGLRSELFRLLNDESCSIRRRSAAARALGRMKEVSAAPLIRSLLSHPDASARGAAIAALGELGDRASSQALRPLLADVDGWANYGVPRRVFELVGGVGGDYTGRPAQRACNATQAARVLASFGDAGSVPALIEMARSADSMASREADAVILKMAACDALGRLGDAAALPLLRELERDSSVQLQYWARRGRLQVEAKNKSLADLLNDLGASDPLVQYCALGAIAATGAKEARSKIVSESLMLDRHMFVKSAIPPTSYESLGCAAKRVLVALRGKRAEDDR